MKRAQLQLPSAVLAELEQEARRCFPEESGGVLLGYRDAKRAELIQVSAQIGPGPKAVHKRHRFEPDGEWQSARIAERYAESGLRAHYLGDWHSHPGGGGTPSGLDRRTAREIANCAEARAPHPLILILFGGPSEWSLAGYRRERWRLRAVETIDGEPG